MAAYHSKLLIERRFPVRLGQQVADLQQAYEDEKAAHWNPLSDIPWANLDTAALDPELREAARVMWSRRLWAAWGYLSETPATLIRLCLELDRPISPKFFLTVRNTQEACQIDALQKLAEAHGGTLPAPTTPAYGEILNRDLSQVVLHADTAIDGFMLAHGAVKIGAEAELYAAHADATTEPVAARALALVAADKRRHAEFGWAFARDRAAGWGTAERAAAGTQVADVMADIVFGGYLTPFTAPNGAAEAERAAERLAGEAGLGAARAAVQHDTLATWRRGVAETLAAWDIDLPAP